MCRCLAWIFLSRQCVGVGAREHAAAHGIGFCRPLFTSFDIVNFRKMSFQVSKVAKPAETVRDGAAITCLANSIGCSAGMDNGKNGLRCSFVWTSSWLRR